MTTKYSKAIKVQEPFGGAAGAWLGLVAVGLVGGTPTNMEESEPNACDLPRYLI